MHQDAECQVKGNHSAFFAAYRQQKLSLSIRKTIGHEKKKLGRPMTRSKSKMVPKDKSQGWTCSVEHKKIESTQTQR
jgi:hypothetical protein